VTVFLALSPLTAATLGAIVLGEHVSSLAGIGLVGVVLGLWLAHRHGETAAPSPLPSPPSGARGSTVPSPSERERARVRVGSSRR